jgi:tetratricopeptide (TPR) repeat protein
MRSNVLLYFSILIIILSSCSSVTYEQELVEAYSNLGNAYNDLGKLEQSSAAFVRALQIDPSFPSAAFNLGLVQIQSGEYESGIKVLKGLLKKEPENILVLKVLAWGYYKYTSLDRAVEIYDSILQLDPYNIDALNNITILMISMLMYEEAYPHLIRLEEAGVDTDSNYYNLGLTERELELSTGLNWFEKAYNKDPGLEKNIIALIEALKIDKDYERVIELYDILLNINSEPAIYFDKAFVLLTAIEDYERGIPALEISLQNGFNGNERIDELKNYKDLLD